MSDNCLSADSGEMLEAACPPGLGSGGDGMVEAISLTLQATCLDEECPAVRKPVRWGELFESRIRKQSELCPDSGKAKNSSLILQTENSEVKLGNFPTA